MVALGPSSLSRPQKSCTPGERCSGIRDSIELPPVSAYGQLIHYCPGSSRVIGDENANSR